MAAKKLTITCLHRGLQESLVKSAQAVGADEGVIGMIGKIPACEKGVLVGFNKRAGKKSAYSEFAAACMKEEGGPVTERMQRCAAKWRERKEK